MEPAVLHNSTPSQHPALSPVQLQVAQALAQGLTISAAARQAGIHRSTIHNWLKSESPFSEAFAAARDDYAATLRDQLQDLAALALDTIRQLLDDPKTPAAVRLRAALAVLNRPRFPDRPWALPLPLDTSGETNPIAGAPTLVPDSPDTPRQPLALTPRNAPCPCGSGRKFKRCCGVHSPPVLARSA